MHKRSVAPVVNICFVRSLKLRDFFKFLDVDLLCGSFNWRAYHLKTVSCRLVYIYVGATPRRVNLADNFLVFQVFLGIEIALERSESNRNMKALGGGSNLYLLIVESLHQ